MSIFTCPDPNCGSHTFVATINGDVEIGVCLGSIPYVVPINIVPPDDLPPTRVSCSFVWDRINDANYFV